jgi:hypothetical protein
LKTSLGQLQRGLQPVEDEVVSGHPNRPTHDYDDIHREGQVKLLSKGSEDNKGIPNGNR